MMKKVWKNRKGVSPVIATILMVAITVVLAAVLYVMVMGFNDPGNNTPTGTISAAKQGDVYKVSVISISKNNVPIGDVVVTISPAVTGADTALTPITGATQQYVTAGDYVEFDGATLTLLPSTTYTVALLYTPTNNNIASTTFTTPAAAA